GEVVAPEDCAGDLMGDLNSRRGRVQGMEMRGRNTVIKAQVPLAEMLTYASDLTSKTGARGSYSMEFDHYDEVPGHLADKIIQKAKAAAAGEEEEEEKFKWVCSEPAPKTIPPGIWITSRSSFVSLDPYRDPF